MARVPKISLEKILAERHGDKPTSKRTDYMREYKRKWRKLKASENGLQKLNG